MKLTKPLAAAGFLLAVPGTAAGQTEFHLQMGSLVNPFAETSDGTVVATFQSAAQWAWGRPFPLLRLQRRWRQRRFQRERSVRGVVPVPQPRQDHGEPGGVRADPRLRRARRRELQCAGEGPQVHAGHPGVVGHPGVHLPQHGVRPHDRREQRARWRRRSEHERRVHVRRQLARHMGDAGAGVSPSRVTRSTSAG